ncbi:UDP-N-acetylmuramoyl-L-alanyl-D-glutamate--2,6-diaminopimelate ligase [Natronogracilivirga saccharolytica]|uniref:UDP-N-acetylmuramoyl-L-alanyl-D-glutamate--2,6-diaminopimelate ligase n=1 Tax=Natronogracilivirga saccharolytica TaxID=2812953 RepID=A0A8J7UU98_9BACT|nr:UDP-N-acetylmuramoyl-L-alanyl-D-glutamate--2,6-diaminopimelate ligase [Natronogracilivirga saccharolytica]MBP3193401.1 UDP-N-acetylmuramoyl-L-alanyl-D-glutamate--2,6-diaminopimelate ligase [Natronogracilivirga saccharolytica]
MMNIADLLHIIHPLQTNGHFDGKPGKLVLDSRHVKKDDVFIALRGTRSDGHHFISEAIRRGAAVIIAEHIPDEHSKTPHHDTDAENGPLYIQVADTRHIAGELAQAFAGYPARRLKMTGITGTNGKTTVSTLVYQVLQTLGYNTGLLGTVETRIGDRVMESHLTTPDPVSLAGTLKKMVSKDTAFAVMEVSSHALEQQRVGGIRFDVGAFTNLSRDHLDYHRDMDAYVEAKQRLFLSLDSDAIAVINRDDPSAHKVIEECQARIWDFGFENNKDFRILDESPEGMVLDLDGTIVSTPLAGRYNAYNVAQAYLICLALGCTKGSVASALGEARGAAGRLERVKPEGYDDDDLTPAVLESAPSVFVDYAHTPDALENVLQALTAVRTEGVTLHVVFGCGGDRDTTKRPEMGQIADQYADVITLTSDNPRTEDPDAIIRDIRQGIVRGDRLYIQPDRRKAIRSAVLDADTSTVVLVAGKGHETYQEVHGRRRKFDDRKVAGKAIAEWIERRDSKKRRQKQRNGRNDNESKKEVR